MRTIRSRMPPLRQRMLEDMPLRNFLAHTMRAYLHCVADFARHFRTSPAHLGPAQGRTSPRFLGQEKPRPWLLPGQPRTRPLTTRAVYSLCRDAGQAAHLPKAIYPPGLRHSFATPLLEAGVALRRSQLWLGHRSLRTTSRSLHVTPQILHAPPSPLDTLPLEQP